MEDFLLNAIQNVKKQPSVTYIPIEEFDGIKELAEFVETSERNGVVACLHHETSDSHQGVVVQIFNRMTIAVGVTK